MRDDFDAKTKDLLAKRVGYRCSNPNCRQLTSGPQSDSNKVLNIGVAAHITAAAKGGPRYDENISQRGRTSSENGIWLCQNCAKLIDNDPKTYHFDLLKEWKRLSEQAARLEIEKPSSRKKTFKADDDIELIRFYSQCLDRPAFQDEFHIEGSMEAFDKAIEDTITAINTGTLRARDGEVLAQGKGKSFLNNQGWRDKMDIIVDMLRAIRSRYQLSLINGEIHLGPEDNKGRQFYVIQNRQVADWIDTTRLELIQIFSEICNDAGIPKLYFPHFRGERFR